MSDALPFVTHSGSFSFMGVDVIVHRLNTGESIIEAESFHALMEVLFGDGVKLKLSHPIVIDWRRGLNVNAVAVRRD